MLQAGRSAFVRFRAPEVPVFEPVGVAFHAEDLGVVNEPVDHRRGDHLVPEDLAPGGESLVRSDDQRGPLVAGADQREHQAGGLGVKGDVADLVDDQKTAQTYRPSYRQKPRTHTLPCDPCR